MKTAYLGQYTDEHANAIAEQLVKANIPWYYKQASFITRALFFGEWGTRLFVEESRLDEAKTIAERVTGVPSEPDDPDG